MLRAEKISNAQCPHTKMAKAEGFALITVGDASRADECVPTKLCDQLEKSTALKDICRFDLGPDTDSLSHYLSSHKGAIIIDSTHNGTAPGTVSIMDLGAMVDRATPINIRSCHGFSLADELRATKRAGRLPKRIIFFGIEINDVELGDKLNSRLAAKLPVLVNNLSLLMSKVLETVKKDG